VTSRRRSTSWSRTRDAYRFVEVVPDARLTVLDGLATASGAVLGGLVGGFLVQLGLTLAVGEVVPGAYSGSERSLTGTLGWWALLVAVGAVALVVTRATATLALARLLTEGRPEVDVPPHAVRARVRTANPPGALTGLAWTTLGGGVLAAALVAPLMLGADDAAGPPTLASGLAVVLASGVCLVLLPRHRRAWARTQRDVAAAWGPNEVRAAHAADRRARDAIRSPRTERADPRAARRRRVGGAVLGVAGGAGFVLFLVGNLVRKPGRHSPRRYYGPFGEASVDVLVGVGAALVGAALLAGALLLVRSVARGARDRRRLRARLHDETVVRLTDAQARDALGAWSPAASAAILALVTVGVLGPSLVAAWTGAGAGVAVPHAWLAATTVAAVLSLVVATWVVVRDVPASARWRARVRERWSPGDPEDPDAR